MKTFKLLMVLLGWTFSFGVLAADPGQILVNTELKSEPYADAQTLAVLAPATAVEVLKRQGGWMQVKPAGDVAGWVRMASLKLGGGTAEKGDSGLVALWNVARSGRSGNTGVTVATGVRGLGAEELKNARPNPEAVNKLKGYSVGRADAESFAGGARLQHQSIDYLAESKAAAPSPAGTSLIPGGGK